MVAPARRDVRLLRHERGEILIADLGRRQNEHQDGETEGGDLRPPRPVTRRDHTQLTQRYATLDDDADLLKIASWGRADDYPLCGITLEIALTARAPAEMKKRAAD